MTDLPPRMPDQDDRPAFLLRDAPLIDSLPERWIEYLANHVAQSEGPPVTRGELGVFIELCAAYGLDPFAHEAWCAKSKTGKLLVMTGRDGLRKIAQRNGIHMDGDVVHAEDEFSVVRTRDGNRTIEHSYGKPAERGAIVGAWAECREGGPLGRPLGFFYAPLEEYQPVNVSQYSPWAKQKSVMILAAAERQAIRQATPLGGIYSPGELESIDAPATAALTIGSGEPGGDLAPEVEAVCQRAEALGYAGLADRGAAWVATEGQPPERIAEWVEMATGWLNDFEVGRDAIDETPDEQAEEAKA